MVGVPQLVRLVVSNVILFMIMAGLSASVDRKGFERVLQRKRAVCLGIALQFVLMPFLGFAAVKIFQVDWLSGVGLLLTTSAPGVIQILWCL